jgi:hypothetical protein
MAGVILQVKWGVASAFSPATDPLDLPPALEPLFPLFSRNGGLRQRGRVERLWQVCLDSDGFWPPIHVKQERYEVRAEAALHQGVGADSGGGPT